MNNGKIINLSALIFLSLFIIKCANNGYTRFTTDAVATITLNSINPVEYSSVNKNTSFSFDIGYEITNYDPDNIYTLTASLYDKNTNYSYSVFAPKDLSGGSPGNITVTFSGYAFYNCYYIFSEICSRMTALPFKLKFSIYEETPDWLFNIGRTDYIYYNEL